MNVELKLLVDTRYKETILRHPLFSSPTAPKPVEQKQVDTYFYTPDMKLRQRYIGLHVRRTKNRWIQTIKGNGSAESGLHSRGEWESAVAGPVPELNHLRDSIDNKNVRRNLAAAPALQKRLVAVLATNVRRTMWNLRLADGAQVECSFDQGTLKCGDKEAPISELELELKSGDVRQLFDLALGLQQDIPLRLGNRSKADRGYALLAPTDPQAIKATPLVLSKPMTVEQAFVAIASNCLAQMQSNDQQVVQGNDVESLHQMRVGMRRFRSALSIFKGLIKVPDDIGAEIAWLSGELGDTRDWDVLAGSALPELANTTLIAEHMGGVQQAAVDEALAHHNRTSAALNSSRYSRLMLSILRWVHTMGWHEDQALMAAKGRKLVGPVANFARQVLRHDQRRLCHQADNLKNASPEARHRLRIAAKKTRYAAEFFGSLFSSRTLRPYVKGLSGLQDELGVLNDIAVAERLLTGLSEQHPELVASVGFVRGFMAARVKNDDKKIVRLWRNFKPLGLPH